MLDLKEGITSQKTALKAYKIDARPLHQGAPTDELVEPGAVLAQDVRILQQPEENVYILQAEQHCMENMQMTEVPVKSPA